MSTYDRGQQLGRGARSSNSRAEYKRVGRRHERRRIRQLATRELQYETSPKRRYFGWY
jgi:hypothetical protein